MFKRLARGLDHTLTLLRALLVARKRAMLRRMIAFSRMLPQQFDQPLPLMMAHLTPPATPADLSTLPGNVALNADDIRQLADAVAAWHLRSALGICLRRTLLRYHFLREAQVPVRVVFGARLKDRQEGGGLGGHAWLTLDDAPYFENPKDYAGFAVMFTYPVEEM